MTRKCVMMGLVILAGAGMVWGATNPAGTIWRPVNGYATPENYYPDIRLNPVIDNVTGNPVQAFWTVGFDTISADDPQFSAGGWFNGPLADTHNYSKYDANALMDTLNPGTQWYRSDKFQYQGPTYNFGDNSANLRSATYDRGAAVWSFIAPQNGYYQVSGTIGVKGYAHYPNTHYQSGNIYYELFTFTGSGHNTYTNLLSGRTNNSDAAPEALHAVNLPTVTVYLATGDMLCIANIGSQTSWDWGLGFVYLNDAANYGTVTVTLLPEPTTAMPTFSPDGGTYNNITNVTVSCTTPGATIRYTTDGTTPTASNGTVIASGGTVQVDHSLDLKARAFGSDESLVKFAHYTININPIGTTWQPVEWYTDPGIATDVRANPVMDGTVTGNPIQAFWVVGFDTSGWSSGTGTIGDTLAAVHTYSSYNLNLDITDPNSNLCDEINPGTYWYRWDKKDGSDRPMYTFDSHDVKLTTAYYYRGAAVWTFIAPQDGYYELSGQLGSQLYNASSRLYYDVGTFTGSGHNTYTNILSAQATSTTKTMVDIPTTVVHMAVGDMIYIAGAGSAVEGGNGLGYVHLNDAPNKVTVKLVSPVSDVPTISPGTGTYTSPQTVTITAQSGATIRYTTNGSDPDNTSSLYTSALTISNNTTLKARAWSGTLAASSVTTAVYSFPTATPVISPGTGFYASAKAVSLSCSTPGAVIRYTTTGIDPDNTSTVYSSPITINTDNTTLKAKAYAAGYNPSAVASAVYYLPSTFQSPTSIPYGSATIDGNLSDWPVFPGSGWTKLDKLYYGTVTDVDPNSGAWYAAKWTENKVYVAIRVQDTQMNFNDDFQGAEDAVELFLHTTGFAGSSTQYDTSFADAQQYIVGPMFSDPNTAWKSLGGSNTMPAQAGFSPDCSVSGSWIYYEAALTPFKSFDKVGSGSVVSTLAGGDVIGLDAVIDTKSNTAYGMLAENLLKWKSVDYMTFGRHVLGYSNSDLAAVLAAMDTANTTVDKDGDGLITSTDLAIVLANMP